MYSIGSYSIFIQLQMYVYPDLFRSLHIVERQPTSSFRFIASPVVLWLLQIARYCYVPMLFFFHSFVDLGRISCEH